MKLQAKQRLQAAVENDQPEQYRKDGATLLKLLAETRYEKLGEVEINEGYEDDPDDYTPGFKISGHNQSRPWTRDSLQLLKSEINADLEKWLKAHPRYRASLWAESSVYWTISVYDKEAEA